MADRCATESMPISENIFPACASAPIVTRLGAKLSPNTYAVRSVFFSLARPARADSLGLFLLPGGRPLTAVIQAGRPPAPLASSACQAFESHYRILNLFTFLAQFRKHCFRLGAGTTREK